MAYKKYSKEGSKEEIKKIIGQFDYDFGGKINPQMKEAQLEDKYIKPFFSYLNWNIHNENIAKGREEFRVQTSHRINKTVKEPDYELWLPEKETQKMKRYLFMEAKDPKYNLKEEVNYIRQAYQYAHSTLNLSDHSTNRTRLSLLTDFEEFRLFDCFDPYPLTTNESVVFNKYIVSPFDFNYTEYVNNFDILWDAFERDNVYNGSLNEFQVTDKELKKKRISPDLKFLDDLKKWRLDFARSMYKSNKKVSDEFLTSASQLLINRIIFIKMLTDRDIEEDYLTKILGKLNKDKEDISIYDSCRDIFQNLDKRYNGDIFKRRDEFDFVKIENKIFKQVIESLRPDKSVYTLSAMPIEIIGNAYEQFLGEVILHKGRGLTSEQKPEVQKAGGVYYTPRYIVDYIVQNTVGEKLKECRKTNDVENIKILDPACGSGSFLIGAYDYLIKWHINYYKVEIDKLLKSGKTEQDIKKKFREKIKYYTISDDNSITKYIIHLTSKLKKQILLNNIFGVDIDNNAVEITKFSLSMKALENSTKDELYEDVDLFNEKILPTLDSNIKTGNSIISEDIFTLFKNINKETELKINPFDWESEFENIIKNDGFDCIIGNPPYITYSLGRGRKKTENVDIEYLIKKWENSSSYKINSFAIFYEFSLRLLNNTGFSSFIVPATMHINDSISKLRKYIIDHNMLLKYMKLDYKVFDDADMGDCSIMILHYNTKNISSYHINSPDEIHNKPISSIEKSNIYSLSDFRFLRLNEDYLMLKENSNFIKLNECCKFYNGIKSGNNKKYISDIKINNKYLPIIRGRDFTKYSPITQEKYILFDKKQLWSNHDENKLSVNPKIIIRQTSDEIIATLDRTGFYPMDTVHMIYDSNFDLKVLLAIINSSFFNKIHATLVPETGKTFAEVKIANLKKMQIPKYENIESKDEITSLVEGILNLNIELSSIIEDNKKNILQKRINRIEKQINDLIEVNVQRLLP